MNMNLKELVTFFTLLYIVMLCLYVPGDFSMVFYRKIIYSKFLVVLMWFTFSSHDGDYSLYCIYKRD